MKTKHLIQTCLLGAVLLQAFSSGAQPVTKVAAGHDHSLFLKGDGSLWAMGDNEYGQLGAGAISKTNQPQQIVASGVTAVAAGQWHSLFLKSDGSLWAMGGNSRGQLGDGTSGFGNQTNLPEQIVASDVTAIAAGGGHSLFLKSDGSLWAMGDNSSGQLGDGTHNTIANLPEQIVASDVTAIAAGGGHSLFLKSDGSLWGMGESGHGQLGLNWDVFYTNRPYQIVASGVMAVAAGTVHSLFLKTDGSLWAMGYNNIGQLGDGTYGVSPYYGTNVPEQIVASNVTAIAGGFYHSLFLKSDGSLWGMGQNGYGQLGLNWDVFQTNLPGQALAGNATTIAAGSQHSLFLKSDGSLWAMGQNYYGQVGNSTYTGASLLGLIVAGPLGFNQIAPQLLDGGALRLSFLGFAGTNYALDRTFNLSPPANWIPLATNPADSLGVLLFTNTPDPAVNTFYRIRSVP